MLTKEQADGDWQPISTAPRDSTPVYVQRVYEGRVVHQARAVWRHYVFSATYIPPVGTLAGVLAPEYSFTGWMYEDCDKQVPTPTHWMPIRKD